MSIFLMLWNPKSGNLSDEDWAEQGEIINGGGLDSYWSIGNRKSGVEAGDEVFLVRTITNRGIVRSGVITGNTVHEKHWDPDRAAEGATVNYAPVHWSHQREIEHRLPVETLLEEVPEVAWNNLYASGIRVPDGASDKLRKVWHEHCAADTEAEADGSLTAVGEIAVGTVFANRKALSAVGLHGPLQGGIAGNKETGATSIVVSGGYEDDEDYGDLIIYTGAGGNDPGSKVQIADQEFTRGNYALAKSCDEGLPVRVIRGAHKGSVHAPPSGYRYDGSFRVESYWHEAGKSGFRIYRFRLRKVVEEETPGGTPEPVPSGNGLPAGSTQPKRATVVVQRIVRNTAVSQAVKLLHKHQCQICRQTVSVPTGLYSEGAHIRPLGKPHGGQDVAGNLLCLCPTCHVRFDSGALSFDDQRNVVDLLSGENHGALLLADGHELDDGNLQYHRNVIAAATT